MNLDHRFFIPFWYLFEIKLHMGEAMSIKDANTEFWEQKTNRE